MMNFIFSGVLKWVDSVSPYGVLRITEIPKVCPSEVNFSELVNAA
mgnify:CR=1 FL=1